MFLPSPNVERLNATLAITEATINYNFWIEAFYVETE